jgi:hypothetical protein
MPQLPAGSKPLFVRDPDLVKKTNQLAVAAAEGYTDFVYTGDPTESPSK